MMKKIISSMFVLCLLFLGATVAAQEVSFRSSTVSVGWSSQALAVADFNNDGHEDIVMTVNT